MMPESLDEPAGRRAETDRRREPTSVWAAFPPAGRRMKNRRAAEHSRPYFVDRFSPAMLMCVLAIVIASLVDAVLTGHILHHGGLEANPLMRCLLDRGLMTFVVGKYALTVVGLPVLLIFKNHYLFGTRLRVGHLLPLCVAMYVLLIGYQIILIENRVGW
jgi:hypothetical protein